MKPLLMIADLQGNLLATSNTARSEDTSAQITHEWIKEARAGRPVIGKAYFDPVLGTRVMVIGEPVWSTNNELLGVLGAKLAVNPIDAVLASHVQSDTDAVFLINSKGRLLTGAGVPADQQIDKRLDPHIMMKLSANQGQPTAYRGSHGLMVIGTMIKVPSLGWAVVVEVDLD